MIGIFLLAVLTFLLSACDDRRQQTVKWTEYEPVYMTQEEFESAVGMEEARELKEPGKIYFYDGFLFVNEVNEGVHIIDNRDPSSPVQVGFVSIPANRDLAVKGNRLYADSHSDLLVFDIEDMQDPELIARVEGVFKVSANMHLGFPYRPADDSKGRVVDWKPVEVEEVCEGDCYQYRFGGDVLMTADASSAESQAAAGVGGSMARFAISGDYLYAVDKNNLLTFDISPEEPVRESGKNVGWAIETIFPYENSLFIGSESAMYIFDTTEPAEPALLSVYNHLTACDPVVVEGDVAYVTLRDGNRCARGVNRLEVIDVSDLFRPKKVAEYPMINPHGLGIDDGSLFISEGESGLKILDAGDPLNIVELRHIKDIKTFDVIPFDNVLMVTGDSGILQYDYSDINDIRHLSTIPVSGNDTED